MKRIILLALLGVSALAAGDKPKELSKSERVEFYQALAALRGAQARHEAAKAKAIPYAVLVEQAQAAMAAFIAERAGDLPCQLTESAEWECEEPKTETPE